MKDPMLMQLFAEETAPQDGAKTEAPAAPEKDAEPAETPAPEAPPEGKQAAPSAEEPGGKRNETPAQKDVENNAWLLAGVAAAMEAKRLNGSLKKIATKAYVITPNNVDVDEAKLTSKKKKEPEPEEEEEPAGKFETEL